MLSAPLTFLALLSPNSKSGSNTPSSSPPCRRRFPLLPDAASRAALFSSSASSRSFSARNFPNFLRPPAADVGASLPSPADVERDVSLPLRREDDDDEEARRSWFHPCAGASASAAEATADDETNAGVSANPQCSSFPSRVTILGFAVVVVPRALLEDDDASPVLVLAVVLSSFAGVDGDAFFVEGDDEAEDGEAAAVAALARCMNLRPCTLPERDVTCAGRPELPKEDMVAVALEVMAIGLAKVAGMFRWLMAKKQGITRGGKASQEGRVQLAVDTFSPGSSLLLHTARATAPSVPTFLLPHHPPVLEQLVSFFRSLPTISSATHFSVSKST